MEAFDEAAPPVDSCPSYVVIDIHLLTLGSSGSASYPNVAEADVHLASPSIGTTYPWTEEIDLHGVQRGGNCGPYSDTVLDKSFGVTQTFYQYPVTQQRLHGGIYLCGYQSLACDSGTPSCLSGFVNFGFVFPSVCPSVARGVYTLAFGKCAFGYNTDASDYIEGTKHCN